MKYSLLLSAFLIFLFSGFIYFFPIFGTFVCLVCGGPLYFSETHWLNDTL